MNAETAAVVRNARPPDMVVRVANVIIRPLLRSPAARAIEPLALLEFDGRRTGQRRRVVVGWHAVDDEGFVVTPAPWRANFANGHAVTVHHRGRVTQSLGTLVDD